MSDMKTLSKKAAKKARVRSQKPLRREFTVRDMNRSSAELLEATRKHGSVTIRSRAGETFEISVAPQTPKLEVTSLVERMRRHRERLAAMGYKEPTAEGWEVISKAIAGEG